MALPSAFDKRRTRAYHLNMKDNSYAQRPAVRLDILALIPVAFAQCPHCELILAQSGLRAASAPGQSSDYPEELWEEHARLLEWIARLSQRFGPSIRIRVIDPQSWLGLWKSLRHRIRRYPAFIINERYVRAGWDEGALEQLLSQAFDQTP